MKRFHEYEKETTETYYALGKGNRFFQASDTTDHNTCKEPKDAYTFRNYERAMRFLEDNSRMLEGFKIYAITHVVKSETHYTVLDCDIYKETQKRIVVAQ